MLESVSPDGEKGCKFSVLKLEGKGDKGTKGMNRIFFLENYCAFMFM